MLSTIPCLLLVCLELGVVRFFWQNVPPPSGWKHCCFREHFPPLQMERMKKQTQQLKNPALYPREVIFPQWKVLVCLECCCLNASYSHPSSQKNKPTSVGLLSRSMNKFTRQWHKAECDLTCPFSTNLCCTNYMQTQEAPSLFWRDLQGGASHGTGYLEVSFSTRTDYLNKLFLSSCSVQSHTSYFFVCAGEITAAAALALKLAFLSGFDFATHQNLIFAGYQHRGC